MRNAMIRAMRLWHRREPEAQAEGGGMERSVESRQWLQSAENARARALQKAMGYTTDDLKRPRIGVANTWGETSPGHIHLRSVAEAVKAGIWQAGGTPFEFNSFPMCPMAVGEHGIRYDTPTRDIIAAEVEASTWLHMFDGLVMISSCDKNVPAHLLAAARLDLPTIIVPGGPMDAGRYRGKDIDITVLDAECWAYGVGNPHVSKADIDALEDCACPGAGACALLGTANTMQCLSEALGLALPGAGTALAVSAKRLWFAKESGRQILQLVEQGLTATNILTPASLMNAIRVLHAVSGSTNAVVHLLALAYELGLEEEINLDLIERLGRETPCITAVIPSGPYTMGDFDEAGGVHAVMKRIEPLLQSEVMTVTGDPLSTNLQQVAVQDSPVITTLEQPFSQAGLAVLRGSLANSAVVRTTVIAKEMMQHTGPAKVFDGQEDALKAFQQNEIQPGDIVIVRYEGPKGGPGLTEVFKVVGYLRALGLEAKCALITDGKISGFAKGPFICQVSPEAAEGGPLAVIRNGDLVEIDIPNRRLDLQIPAEELQARIAAWKRPTPRVTDGFLTVYARLANPVEKGAGINLRIE
ncbi:dihydroxy-acid dehydratase [candidate division KSB3 bacterium]|uniref:Dihydroxy-acid dehydratase n=1 Tax=candidate division KSB3 bacterium TaxID=2044937 RepID=A0A9D5K089_9BACT|nr:dihydroxy-acid dehydratase [candidate division KSB3 bacterium]MBD3327572.1 dihydroxy-acid dehydratase [candidate division KSB3 bacterium]